MNAPDRFAQIGWTIQPDGCWIWNGRIDNHGYGDFRDGAKHVKAHRYALAAGERMPDTKTLACHHCDTRACVRPDHLYWGNHKSNNTDMNERGRARYRGRSLTDADRDYIRENYVPGKRGGHRTPGSQPGSLPALAKQFGVAPQTIWTALQRARPMMLGEAK